MLKKIFCLLVTLMLVGCGGYNPITEPRVTPEMACIEPVTDTNNCKYIKTVYFEVSHPAWINSYAAKNVIIAGGDSYKILSTTEDMTMGIKIYGTNITIYKCK